MSRRRKRVMFLLKSWIAGVPLLWVGCQTHWQDVAVAGDRTYTVLAAEPSSAHPDRFSVILTLLSQGLWISSLALVGLSLGLAIPAPEYLLYVPMIMIIGAVPLTPGGSGVVEELLLLIFAGLAAPSAILALALLTRLVTVVCSLPGLVHMMSGPRIPLAEEMEAEFAEDISVS